MRRGASRKARRATRQRRRPATGQPGWRAIASGQTTAEQVVRDWTASPEHCANLMNAELVEMGIAYAVNMDSPQGIYWAQELARPR